MKEVNRQQKEIVSRRYSNGNTSKYIPFTVHITQYVPYIAEVTRKLTHTKGLSRRPQTFTKNTLMHF